jgi:hypothetical protein
MSQQELINLMQKQASLIQPGDYNIDYNQKLKLLKFEKGGTFVYALDVATNFIASCFILILMGLLCWFVYKMIRKM